MIGFEIKKIFSRPGYQLSLALLLAVTLLISWFAIGYVEYIDENGDRQVGFAAARSLEQEKAAWEGPLTEETLRRVIRENRAVISSPDYNSGDIRREDMAYAKTQGFRDIRDMINWAFCPYRELNAYRIDSLTQEDMTRFYGSRTDSLRTWLYSEEADSRFTEGEKQFLLGRYAALEQPYDYAYSDGWEAVLEYAPSIIMLTMLFISFYVCGIFARETQLKADAIFFSSRLGRSAAVRAKVWAGFVITSGVYWSVAVIYSAAVLMVTGAGGGSCPIQIWIGGWKSYCNLSFFQLYLLTFLGGWIGTLAITAIAMAISAKTRSSLLAVSVPTLLLFAPSFLGNLDSFSRLLGLLPEQLLTLSTVVSSLNVYTLGGTVVGSIPILLTLYSLMYLLLLPVMYGVYRRTQLL